MQRALPWPPNKLFLQVSQSCYFVFYEQGGRCPDWLTCKQILLGGHGKVRRTVNAVSIFSSETHLFNF